MELDTNREQEFIARYALLQIKGIGVMRAQKLLENVSSANALYGLSEKELKKWINIPSIRKAIDNKSFFEQAERELKTMKNLGISFLFPEDEDYPYALKNITDAPQILYYKGTPNWNEKVNIAIVGTRKCTTYGKENTRKIIESLAPFPCHIISGLALGIDAQAHQTAIENTLLTFAVLAHGLDQIYPAKNKALASRLLEKGAILTEYSTQDPFKRENFLSRNRIIAGMCQTTIIVESKFGGGAMTTAKYAFNYDRELYAVPGRTSDLISQGCNFLIKNMQARLLLAPEEVYQWFGEEKPKQKTLFPELSKEEEKVVALLQESEKVHVDDLAFKLDIPTYKLLPLLLELEFKEVVKALAGKYYAIQ